MKKVKLIGWLLSLLVAGGLILLVRWHDELRTYALAHHDLAFYVLLALILAIPARLIALVAAYLTELLFVGWTRSSLKMLWEARPSVRLDALAIIVVLLLPHRHLGWLLSFGLLYAADVYTQDLHLSLTPLFSLWILQVLAFLLFQSCLHYWLHRLEHAIPALWSLHKFHHSADRMSILTAARETHLARGVEALVIAVPTGLFTAPTVAMPAPHNPVFAIAIIYFAYQTFIVMNSYFCHSNLDTGYGWIGRWLIVSPRMHRLHHATLPEYYNKNFSFDLVVWDRLFGTYAAYEPAMEKRTIPIGLSDSEFNRLPTFLGSVREYFVVPYLVFWRQIRRGIVAWRPERPAQAGFEDRAAMGYD